jgi:23S rRNA (guanosine2251-2'-O)-methyltransferase
MKTETLFGIHAVSTLIDRNPTKIMEIWVQKGREDKRMKRLLDKAAALHIHVREVGKDQLTQKVDGNHQGIVAFRQPVQALNERELPNILAAVEGVPFILILDGVTDPHNLGACIRTADAAGVQLVIAPKDKSAPLNATASKVACGAAEVIPYVQVTNLSRTIKELQEQGIWIIGAAGEADSSIYEQDLTGPIALVMGAEGNGMRRLTKECCDFLVNIPMAGEVSSVNVSVATGVSLFEAVRQRLGEK